MIRAALLPRCFRLVPLWAMLLLAALLPPLTALAQQEAGEEELKAAFLFNFASYVEWPPQRFSGIDAPLIFGVLDGGDLAEHLEAIVAERPVKERPGIVRRIRRREDLDGLHVLFLGREYQHLMEEVLFDTLAEGVLTVTESNRPPPAASVINLSVDEERVRFDVSLSAAAQGGLEVSARLLQLAREVTGPAP